MEAVVQMVCGPAGCSMSQIYPGTAPQEMTAGLHHESELSVPLGEVGDVILEAGVVLLKARISQISISGQQSLQSWNRVRVTFGRMGLGCLQVKYLLLQQCWVS